MSHLVGIDPSNNTCIDIGYLKHRVDLGVSRASLTPDDLTHPPSVFIGSGVEAGRDTGDADGHPWAH